MLLDPCSWFLTGQVHRPGGWSSLPLTVTSPERESTGLLLAAWIGGGR